MNPAAKHLPSPSLRDHITDSVEGYAIVPLLAAATPLLAGLFGKKKKKKKPKPPPPPPKQNPFAHPAVLIAGGIGVVALVAVLSLSRSKK